jgi:chromosome segregation ATPase
MAEAARVLGDRFERLSDAVEALEARCAAAETERDQLEREVARTQDALAELRQERQALETMRREIARMAALLVERTIEQSLQPLHALAARLRPGPTTRAFTEEVRGPVDSRDDSA